MVWNLGFPEASSVMLIVRGNKLIPSRGRRAAGLTTYMLALPEGKWLLQLTFGSRGLE